MSTPPEDRCPAEADAGPRPGDESVPADPATVTQEQVLDAFTDDDPRPTALVADRLDADAESVERALRDLERQGVLERRERDARTTLWLPARRKGRSSVTGPDGLR
ncbi:hypothetical protein ACFO0N_06090 [Halobium salinum]|uniref:MarR family transcriptional regulator n=1 Tax=Halobium salinum TaxID=1364940 RepID=A0ABD5P9Z8_9EURY|nr:hypothetical protein [Halobium salinum]